MTLPITINGFGRIGRPAPRAALGNTHEKLEEA